MSLAPGSRLGPYEIVSSLGAGGMGEVWRARDTRLGREVAVKVLAPHLVAQPEVRARFEREARSISSLNHPHICVLHDVGRDGDTDYLVMELVEGETLARRLKRGPLPVAEALRLGAQIADALDRAHRSGIVHRDLKPGNVMLAKSGAKLMDFGLARVQSAEARAPLGASTGGMSVSPTMSRPLTAEGTIVGTFQYMAPEQLEGAEADARSDVWAFGCVLYEMLSGRAPFEGRSQASLISAIMKDEPRPLAGSGSGTALGDLPPPQLDRLVRRCLAKDPDDRWQAASDLKHELQWMSGASNAVSGAPVVVPRPAARRAWVPRVAWMIGAVAVTALATGLVLSRGSRDGASLMRFDVPEARGMRFALPAEMAVSPDGSKLVCVGEDSSGVRRLYVRDLGTTGLRVVGGSEGASLPFWSPDARWIGFFADATLRKLPVEGGTPVMLAPAQDARGGSWSPRGVIVFAPGAEGVIHRVSADGGATRPVTELRRASGDRSQRYPCFLPDGRHFLYIAVRPSNPHGWYVGDVEGGPSKAIGEGETAPVWSPDGFVLWTDEMRVVARRFDPNGLKLAPGEPRLVGLDAFRDNFGYPNVAVGKNGLLFQQHYRPGDMRLTWRSPDGSETPAYSDPLPALTDVGVSHDGRRLVYSNFVNGAIDLWLQDVGGGAPVRLTTDGGYKTNLLWSADDQRILYARASTRGGYEVRMIDFVSGADTLILRPTGTFAFPSWWDPEGRTAIVCATDSTGAADVWFAPTDGSGPPRRRSRTPIDEYLAQYSPDRRSLIAFGSIAGRLHFWIEPAEGPGPRVELPWPDNVTSFQISPSGRELALEDVGGALWSVPIDWGPPPRFGKPRRIAQQDRSNVFNFLDGRGRILLARRGTESRVSSLEGVLHWPRAIERR